MLGSARPMSSLALDTVVQIDTPEHLAFRNRLAGPSRRFLAWLLDTLVWGILVLVLFLLSSVLGAAGLEGVDTGIMLLGLFALWYGYFFVWELATAGRSPGKMALRLRVVQGDGLPLDWRASLLRNLLRTADLSMLPGGSILFLGPIVMLFDPRFRRVGDWVADTLVIVEERTRVRDDPASRVPPELVASLPSVVRLDGEEMEALAIFSGRSEVGAARREELARTVAPMFARRLGIPPPARATEFLIALYARANRPPEAPPVATGGEEI